MPIAGLTLPTLTEADPPISGEGSLDPLGARALAERIAEQLAPDVRARMGLVRFLTAMSVGAVVADELGEVLIRDSRATPAIAFEWILTEGFVRRKLPLPSGIPGLRKARGGSSLEGAPWRGYVPQGPRRVRVQRDLQAARSWR